MSASAPWSVKGIDAKAREVAKDLARRSGMTLGEWLNQMILDGEDVGAMITRERERSEGYAESAPSTATRMRRPPVYRETQNDIDDAPRRPAAYAAESRDAYAVREPHPQRQITSGDLRRRSIFEDRPRYDEERDDRAASDEMARVARALESLSARIEGSEGRSANAVRGVSTAVESLLDRLERSEAATADAQDRLQEASDEFQSTVERQSQNQGALSGRLEKAERLINAQAERIEGLSGHLKEERERVARVEAQLKSPQAQDAIRSVEGVLGKLANQLYEGEQRTRDTVKDVRQDMVGLSHRLTQIELRDPERAAQGAIDKVVARMAERLERAEAQTSGAIRALEQAFTTLDARLGRAEERGDVTDPESVQSLTRLANDLSRRVDESRAELLSVLEDRTQASAEQMLNTLSDRIAQSEKRSAAAIDKLGQDVVRVANSLSRRVSGVETAQQAGVTRIDAEMRRVADSVEHRFARQDTTHAQALERLGGEIARISDRLTQRMNESERRAAQAVEGVGAFIEQHRDQARNELSERIRQSEDRTAKLLEDARNRIDQKLAQVQTQGLLSETLARPEPRAEASGLPNPFAADPLDSPQVRSRALERMPFSRLHGGFEEDAAPEAISETVDDAIDLTGRLLDPVTEPDVETLRAETAFTPEYDPFESDEFVAAAKSEVEDDDSDPFAEIEVSRKTAPRVAAHAARSDETIYDDARSPYDLEDEIEEEDLIGTQRRTLSEDDFEDSVAESGVSVSTRDALAAARAAVRASMEGLETPKSGLGSLGLKASASKTRGVQAKPAGGPKDNTLVRAAQASGVAAVAVALAVGVVIFSRGEPDGPRPLSSPPLAATAVVAPDAHDPALLKAELASAMQALEAHAPGAVQKVEQVASQGYAPAQYMMSRIYHGEDNYAKPDAQAERLWTKRAADGGVARAMYNYGVMLVNGDGGPIDVEAAAIYFRKSAQYGITSGQYNLGLMLVRPDMGLTLNPSEAYRWLSIAAKSGDKDAKQQAEIVGQTLTDAQRRSVDAAVAAFVPANDGFDDSGSVPQG